MKNFNDLQGQRFGRLSVLSRAPNDGKRAMWLCKCDCGNMKTTRSSMLSAGIQYFSGKRIQANEIWVEL